MSDSTSERDNGVGMDGSKVETSGTEDKRNVILVEREKWIA